MSERLFPSQRINQSRTFDIIFKKGNRFQGRLFNLWTFVAPEDSRIRGTRPKLAIMVSRKVFPKAADRNLWKRRIRESFRRFQHRLVRKSAVIFQAKRQPGPASYQSLEQEMHQLLEKAKILQ